MKDKRSEQIWRAVHGELELSEQEAFEGRITEDTILREAVVETSQFHESLSSAYESEEEWLESMTSRVLEEIDSDERRAKGHRKRLAASLSVIAAVLLVGLLSWSLIMPPAGIHWGEPSIAEMQYRGSSTSAPAFAEADLLVWHEGYQSEVLDLFDTLKAERGVKWLLALSFQEVDEGLKLEVRAERLGGEGLVRTWTFFGSNFEALDASRKAWAETVVRGIVAEGP